MNDLVIGIVYKLKNCNYIGSTYEGLTARQIRHNTDCYKPQAKGYNIPLYKYLRKNKIPPQMKILGYYFVSKKGLRYIEQQYILKYNSIENGLNCVAAYRSDTDKKKYAKEYRNRPDRKKITKKVNRAYTQANKERLKIQQIKYKNKNKEKISIQKNQYYEKNKEKWTNDEVKAKRSIRAKRRVKCPICNIEISNSALRRHKKRLHIPYTL